MQQILSPNKPFSYQFSQSPNQRLQPFDNQVLSPLRVNTPSYSPKEVKIMNIPHNVHPSYSSNSQNLTINKIQAPNRASLENFDYNKFKADRELNLLLKKVQILEDEKTKLLNLQSQSTNILPRESSKSHHIMKVTNSNSDTKHYESIKIDQYAQQKDKENLFLQNQIKYLMQENDNLKKENKNLQETKIFMNSEIEKLEKYVKDLLSDNEALQQKYQEKYIEFQKSKLLKSELALANEEIQSKIQEINILKEQLNFKSTYYLNDNDRQIEIQHDLETLNKEIQNFIEFNKQIDINNKANTRMILHLLREKIIKLQNEKNQDEDEFKMEQDSADFSGKFDDLSDLNEKCKQIYDQIFQRNKIMEKHESEVSFSHNFEFPIQ